LAHKRCSTPRNSKNFRNCEPGTGGKRANIYFLLHTITRLYSFKGIKDKILNLGREPEIIEQKQR
jgi:hypothetical protein